MLQCFMTWTRRSNMKKSEVSAFYYRGTLLKVPMKIISIDVACFVNFKIASNSIFGSSACQDNQRKHCIIQSFGNCGQPTSEDTNKLYIKLYKQMQGGFMHTCFIFYICNSLPKSSSFIVSTTKRSM